MLLLLLLSSRAGRLWSGPLRTPGPRWGLLLLLLLGSTLSGVCSSSLSCTCCPAGAVGRGGLLSSPRGCRRKEGDRRLNTPQGLTNDRAVRCIEFACAIAGASRNNIPLQRLVTTIARHLRRSVHPCSMLAAPLVLMHCLASSPSPLGCRGMPALPAPCVCCRLASGSCCCCAFSSLTKGCSSSAGQSKRRPGCFSNRPCSFAGAEQAIYCPYW